MRIDEIRTLPYRLPLTRPLKASWGTLEHRSGWAVAVRDETGKWGLGEAAPLPGFGMESLEACQAALDRFAGRCQGAELDLPAAGAGLAAVTEALAPVLTDAGLMSRGMKGSSETPAARHGIEQALLDRAANRAGLPLARWLNPEAPGANGGQIAVNATLGGDPPGALAQAARKAVAEGYRTLKIKVGLEPPARDRERIEAVRNAVGAAIALRLDANGAWGPQVAREALAAFAPLDIEYAEQPLAKEDIAGMAALAAESPISLAADESVDSLDAARRIVETGAARILILKPMVLGGILPALELCREAARENIETVVTTSLEGAIGRLGALHTAAARAGTGPACGLATGSWLAEDLLDPPPPEGALMALPQLPGLGWRDEQAVGLGLPM